MDKINVLQEMDEIKKVLSYSKNIGFFFGAGTSCALGLPDVITLTNKVEDKLDVEMQNYFKNLKLSLKILLSKDKISVEDILNYVRQISEITGECKDRVYDGINGENSKKLDKEICKCIFEIIKEGENIADTSSTKKFLVWLDMINRNCVKEIYTTNYDLLFEKSMESNYIPYFDGFVGAYEPFFWSESIDKFVLPNDSTYSWIRLWKLHGSLNWAWKTDDITKSSKIIRVGKIDEPENELVIYPSKEKYNLSRKQPFIAYFDRLKNYLLHGELLFIFSGYSFSDQHINEIVLNCLRQNPRLYSIVICFSDNQVKEMEKYASAYLNLCVLGPESIILNGKMYLWEYDESIGKTEQSELFWDKSISKFLLGDFKKMVDFLVVNSGKSRMIEDAIHGK